ncbi:MAG: alpha-amylase family glycosyl hydrolase [Candidatus Eremiobacteraeota bacterium]|nr:alpha-amylase family glycosyl hydrolase [Candidatus Eremiobacteraeota bacterium]
MDTRLLKGIHHDGSPLFVSSLAPSIGDEVTVRLRMPCAFVPEKVALRTSPDGEQEISPMHKAYDDRVSSWWEGTLKVHEKVNHYRFFLLHEGKVWWYTASGLAGATLPDSSDFRIVAGDQHPCWTDRAVFYQIFPDRFAKGEGFAVDGAYHYDGYTRIERSWGEAPLAHEQAGNVDFFGGNLKGITDRLDYLSDLGVSALYLNPIFTAPSNHKYDSIDYFSVDPSLGGDNAFADLMESARGRGMKVILDVALNHCGVLHLWFQEALRDPGAPSAEFFTFYRHPGEYEMWKGVKTLPKLNYRSEVLRGIMYRDDNSMVRKWMKPPYSIDGWRVDVANMLARQGEQQLGHEVGRELRCVIKGERPEAYLVGEHFFDGTSHLGGDELDASMNYQGFAFPFWSWLSHQELWWIKGFQEIKVKKLSTCDLLATWKQFMAAIPWITARRQFNFLSNHDTPRILHILEGNRRMAAMAAAVLFAYPGVPSVYYGDEIGLSGKRDPGCRECFPWNSEAWNGELRSLYQKLISLRRSSSALAEGGFEILHGGEDLFAFKRESLDEIVILVANRSPVPCMGLELEAGLHGISEHRLFNELPGGGSFRVKEGRLTIPSVPGESFLLLRSTS